MTTLSRKKLRQYFKDLDDAEEQSVRTLKSSLESLVNGFKNAETEEERSYFREAITNDVYSRIESGRSISETRADDIFEEMTGMRNMPHDGFKYEIADARVRSAADHLFKKNSPDKFVEALESFIIKEVRDSANSAIADNMGGKKRSKNLKLGMFTHPGCTCGVCLMQESRKFIFSKPFNPHKSNASCRCRFIPGDGDGVAVNSWNNAGEIKRTKLSKQSGGKVDYSTTQIDEFGTFSHDAYENGFAEKSFIAKGNEWRDIYAHITLAEHGFEVRPRASSAIGIDGKVLDGVTLVDVDLNGVMWEIKSPSSYNERTIESQFKKAINRNFKNPYDEKTKKGMGQVDDVNVVINARYIDADINTISDSIELRMKKTKVNNVLLVTNQGDVYMYTK